MNAAQEQFNHQVRKMGEQARAMGHRIGLLQAERDQLKTRAAELEGYLRSIAEQLCHQKIGGEVTFAMVQHFVAGEIEKQYDMRLNAQREREQLRDWLAELQAASSAEILGHDLRHYLHTQFPATVGHIPLDEWLNRLADALERNQNERTRVSTDRTV